MTRNVEMCRALLVPAGDVSLRSLRGSASWSKIWLDLFLGLKHKISWPQLVQDCQIQMGGKANLEISWAYLWSSYVLFLAAANVTSWAMSTCPVLATSPFGMHLPRHTPSMTPQRSILEHLRSNKTQHDTAVIASLCWLKVNVVKLESSRLTTCG